MPNRENEAAAIRNLQRYLRQLSFDEESITRPPIDGIFESDTRDALRAFQILKGLTPTGTADQETWELLYATYLASLARNSPPRTVAIFPRSPDLVNLSLGSRGFPVTTLQHMLTELTFNYSDLDDFDISGTFDEPTRNAVITFQSQNVLEQTGIVDRLTWNEITDQYNVLFTRYPVE